MTATSSRLCAAFPVADMVACGTVCLIAGITIGFILGRASKTHPGGVMPDMSVRVRSFYERWSPVAVMVIGILAAVGIWIGAAASITNARQDADRADENKARDLETSRLLKCFDQYAQAASASSSAVREASVIVDEATGIRDDALAAEGDAFKRVVRRILAHTVTDADVKHLADTLQQRARTSRALDRAQGKLDQARRENPVPPPPSKFCNPTPEK